MCHFKPGDEVVCVWASEKSRMLAGLREGSTYVVASVFEDAIAGRPAERAVGVTLVGVSFPPPFTGFQADWFRKVQRRNIQDWLKQETSYDEEQHAPAPKAPAKKERVS